MKEYVNSDGDIVRLTDKTAINKYGDKLLWVECQNGAIVSIFETAFKKTFKGLLK